MAGGGGGCCGEANPYGFSAIVKNKYFFFINFILKSILMKMEEWIVLTMLVLFIIVDGVKINLFQKVTLVVDLF